MKSLSLLNDSPALAPASFHSPSQLKGGGGGGGGEVVVRGRLGVAERVMGVEVEPAVKEEEAVPKRFLAMSLTSTRSVGTKGGAFGFPNGLGLAIMKCGVARS